jgi:hypothetical protein
MGANAVTTVPVYTAGEVLTAADLNITNSGIPVFADSTARDNSFGGAGEKTLAEGQFAYIEATNTTQYYDGAAWQSVGTTPGLVFITGASFSAAATVSMAAGVFTATYKNYVVYLNCTTAAAGTVNIRVNVGGTPQTGASAYYSGYTARGSGGAANAGSNTSSMTLGPSVFGAYSLGSVITCFDPNTNTGSIDSNITAISTTFWDTVNPGVSLMGGGTDGIGAYDGLTFTSSTTITGTYKVYGVSNS